MKKTAKLGMAVLLAALIALALIGCGEQEPPVATYAEGVTIEGVALAGLTEDEARELLTGLITAPGLGSVTVEVNGTRHELDLSGAAGTVHMDEALSQGLAYDEEENPVPEGGVDLTLAYSYDLTPIKDEVLAFAESLCTEPVDATYTFDKNAEGCFVYTAHTDGMTVNGEELYAALCEYVAAEDFSQPLTAAFTVVPAAVTLEDVQYATQLVSSATSSYASGSNNAPNRVFNLEKALGMFDGYVLGPGEEFSFNTVLGPRYSSLGWKSAGAINNGKSVQEPGGGVCQVSSTTFNAVLMADLTVVERAPHSWPLAYLPAGQDATINTGTQDFIFRNDRETPVILVTEINKEEETITVSIYGEPLPDGLHIELESERTGTISQPEDEYVVDSTLSAGSKVQDRKGRSGSTYDTYKIYLDEEGNVVERVFAYSTRYRAISAIYHISQDVYDVMMGIAEETPPVDEPLEELPPEDEPVEEAPPADEPVDVEEQPAVDEATPTPDPAPAGSDPSGDEELF